MENPTFPTLSEDLEWEMAVGTVETSKRGQTVSVRVWIYIYVCVKVCERVKWVKVSGENVRKAVGELDTSLKAADEGFREAENQGERGFLARSLFLRDCWFVSIITHTSTVFLFICVSNNSNASLIRISSLQDSFRISYNQTAAACRWKMRVQRVNSCTSLKRSMRICTVEYTVATGQDDSSSVWVELLAVLGLL